MRRRPIIGISTSHREAAMLPQIHEEEEGDEEATQSSIHEGESEKEASQSHVHTRGEGAAVGGSNACHDSETRATREKVSGKIPTADPRGEDDEEAMSPSEAPSGPNRSAHDNSMS